MPLAWTLLSTLRSIQSDTSMKLPTFRKEHHISDVPPLLLISDWLTHSEFLVAWWLQTEILEGMRDKLMTTVSLCASWGLSHLAAAQSSAPVWWFRAFTIRGGWNIISFHLTRSGLFRRDVAKTAPRQIFSLNGSMIYPASFCLCMSFFDLFRWAHVRGRKEGEEEVWWTVCHMINLHPLQLLFKWSHLGTNMSHSIIIRPARPHTFMLLV